MMKTMFTLLCLLTFIGAEAQERTKEYVKTYPAEGLEELVLTGGNGSLELTQTEEKEIHMEIAIRVSAKSMAKADEVLEKIRVREVRTGNYLELETVYDKEASFQQFMAGFNMHVTCRMSVPKNIRVRIVHANGGVYLGDFEGHLNVDLRNGDFKASSLKGGEFYIKHFKGDFSVGSVGVMSADFKDCTFVLDAAQEIRLEASSCDGRLKSVDKLAVRSSGGTMKIGDVEALTGSSSFTKYEVEMLGDYLDMGTKMGEMNILNIQRMFTEIRLKSSFTKVGLNFPESAGYHLELTHNKSLKMDLPRTMMLEERPAAVRNKTVGVKHVGNVKYTGKVLLDLSNGSLYIR